MHRKGFGVPAVTVESAEILAEELERALTQKGCSPHLFGPRTRSRPSLCHDRCLHDYAGNQL
jgi:hypothetical protein